MSHEGPFTIDIVGKADFNPLCDPNSFSFFPVSEAVGVIQKRQSGFSVMRNTGLWSKAQASYDVVFLFFPFLSYLLFWQLVGLCVPCRTLDQAGGWWHHYCFIFFPLGTVGACCGVLSTENTWFLFPWEKVSLSSAFFFLFFGFPARSEERTKEERGTFFPPLSFMLSFQTIDSPPTLLVGRILLSLAVFKYQPWSHRHPRSSAFCASIYSLGDT